ncbi:hypothetical protein EVAR_85665_1 [Eumeta japonica]|uniref:Uncharacterized protein n=1 Tax=Eumeta variegata TaxID=151549 RepID=A0A4C1WAH9_EUMVA|nr:hypothetical protein EVAR_85665_1 [Eumeta japonica]
MGLRCFITEFLWPPLSSIIRLPPCHHDIALSRGIQNFSSIGNRKTAHGATKLGAGLSDTADRRQTQTPHALRNTRVRRGDDAQRFAMSDHRFIHHLHNYFTPMRGGVNSGSPVAEKHWLMISLRAELTELYSN